MENVLCLLEWRAAAHPVICVICARPVLCVICTHPVSSCDEKYFLITLRDDRCHVRLSHPFHDLRYSIMHCVILNIYVIPSYPCLMEPYKSFQAFETEFDCKSASVKKQSVSFYVLKCRNFWFFGQFVEEPGVLCLQARTLFVQNC